MDHPPHRHVQPQQPADDAEWAAMAAHVELEAEVLISFLTDTSSLLTDLSRQNGLDVRRVIDIGSGPGVGTAVLAEQFPSATVVAVDGSAEMLESVARRAEELHLSERVETRHVELPAGFEEVGTADLVWAAMVLHHVGVEAGTLRSLRSLLEPGGLLGIAEFGDRLRFLADSADMGVGEPGLWERLDAAGMAWLESTRPGSPQTAASVDYPTTIEAAGFELVVDQVMGMHLEPPLETRARRVALGHLQRMRHVFDPWLEPSDRDALDVLIAEGHPLGIMQRDDAFLHASRHLYVARAVPAKSANGPATVLGGARRG